MNKMSVLKISLAIAFVFVVNSCQKTQLIKGHTDIIPLPQEMITTEGFFEINSKTEISVQNEDQKKIAQQLIADLKRASGWELKLGKKESGSIVFKEDPALNEEAYTLSVTPGQILISASSGAGYFYGMQTLKQMLPAQFFAKEQLTEVAWGIPSVEIKDEPAFEWRGYMLDVSRHFFDVSSVKKVIDFMAESKLNRFHWHLTDDQGWRLEIKKYPKLTKIGAWRMDYNATDENTSNWFGRPVQQPGEKATYGGFYTQEEVKEIIAYAKERHIEVIPEIDMPGHAQATVAAYPEIGCVNAEPFVATGGVFKNNTYNPGKEVTFEFAENVLNEVMDLFPFGYVHIGGDECNKEQWKLDPDAQRRIREEGLKDEHELQSYFIKRIETIINKRGKTMIGWDEILEGGIAPNATLMSWRGEKGGIIAARAGHEVIMTPNKYCYIDLKQGHDDLEPNLGYSELLLSKAYSYQVIPDQLSEDEGKRIKGIQANLWTESITDWGKLTYMTFPRLFAVAETGWTAPKSKNWDNFTKRLYAKMDRFEAEGTRHAVSAFSPWIEHKGVGNEIEFTLSTEVNGLEIYYSTDGSEPSRNSARYEKPFKIEKSGMIKARSFKGEKPVGTVSELYFEIGKTQDFESESIKVEKLTDLNYAKLNNGDRNWVLFRNGMEVELEFKQPTEVKEVSFNSLRFTISGVYPPQKVEIWGSENGKDYTKIAEADQKEISHIQGRNKIKTKINFDPVELKSLKIIGTRIEPIPDDHHKKGENSMIKVDEIVIK